MKIKMWCVINKSKNKVIQIRVDGSWVVGFTTRKDLVKAITIDGIIHLDSNEEIRKVTAQTYNTKGNGRKGK